MSELKLIEARTHRHFIKSLVAKHFKKYKPMFRNKTKIELCRIFLTGEVSLVMTHVTLNIPCERAVRVVARFFFESMAETLDLDEVSRVLIENEFTQIEIEQTILWIEKLNCAGNIGDTLGMFDSKAFNNRLESPIENICIPEKIMKTLHSLRSRALISSSQFECLLESLRIADPRDWDKEDIENFIDGVFEGLRQSTSNHIVTGLKKSRKSKQYFS